jgi:hypothetical protein
MVSEMDIYLFDLLGYRLLKGALSAEEVKGLNDGLDAIPRLKPGEWHGYVHGHHYNDRDGINYQQIYEGGPVFEKMIDHPAWIDHVKAYVGSDGSFDMHHGPLFIDETFANYRGPGQGIGMHSGGNCWSKRNSYRFKNGHFMNCQVNVLLALTDIGPGDGGTVIIPASHKQNFEHPELKKRHMGTDISSGEGMEASLEVHMKAGDALIFTDTICHGSARRSNPGERRILVQRYGPSWGFFRHGYRPSKALLSRLNPVARGIVWPHNVIREDDGTVR